MVELFNRCLENREKNGLSPFIRIGNQTSAYVSASRPFEFAVEHGFSAFEWFSDRKSAGWCEADTDLVTRQRWRQVAIDHDIAFSVHAPYAASPISAAGNEAIRRSIDFAADVGSKVVNFHLFSDAEAERFADAVGDLLEVARAAGVMLTLENTPLTSPDRFNAIFRIFSTMSEAEDRVGMCFDSGHANLHSETRNDYLRFFDELEDHVPIAHWHAHENWGDYDSHLTLFTGPAGHDSTGLRLLSERLVRRGFCGSIILEQWPDPPELLVEAAKSLQKLLEDSYALSRSRGRL